MTKKTSVLIAYASKHGSTKEIAEFIGTNLSDQGFGVTVKDVSEVNVLDDYDVIILGSAVYAGSWMSSAKVFSERFKEDLLGKPLWLFSSGQVGSPPKPETNKSSDADNIMRSVKVIDYRHFSGRLDKDLLNIAERAIIRAVKASYGDYRNWEDIKSWAVDIARHLRKGA